MAKLCHVTRPPYKTYTTCKNISPWLKTPEAAFNIHTEYITFSFTSSHPVMFLPLSLHTGSVYVAHRVFVTPATRKGFRATSAQQVSVIQITSSWGEKHFGPWSGLLGKAGSRSLGQRRGTTCMGGQKDSVLDRPELICCTCGGHNH